MNNINTLYTSFIENRNTVKKVFSSESSYIIPISANVFCVNDVMADADELKKCKKLIKKNEGLFSTLRGNIRSVIAAKLSISDDPENKLMEISRINALLKNISALLIIPHCLLSFFLKGPPRIKSRISQPAARKSTS